MPLTIQIPDSEFYDSEHNLFFTVKGRDLVLEHSLISISKWESKWKKPFLTPDTKSKSNEEIKDYVRCMTISKNVDPKLYEMLTPDNYKAISDYLDDSMTATTFSVYEKGKTTNKKTIITSEVIYYWMIQNGIPFSCEKWNFNRLLTLLRLCSVKNNQENKMSKNAIYEQNRSLNKLRQAKLKTRG